MKYLILKESDCPLYLVDRSKTKVWWWTYKLSLAMKFTSEKVADSICSNLKYDKCRVITEQEAINIRKNANEVHERESANHDIIYDDYDPGDSEYWDNSDNYIHTY
jgi:hypothetical protein